MPKEFDWDSIKDAIMRLANGEVKPDPKLFERWKAYINTVRYAFSHNLMDFNGSIDLAVQAATMTDLVKQGVAVVIYGIEMPEGYKYRFFFGKDLQLIPDEIVEKGKQVVTLYCTPEFAEKLLASQS